MNPDTTPTPRWVIKKGDFDGKPYLWDDQKYDNYDLGSLCRILNEYEEKTNEVERLREELDRLKRGCQGSCYACEPVGEMNLKLEAEVARLGNLLENMTQSRDTMIEDRNLLDNEVARLREVCEWAADMMDGISPARGQEIRDAVARLAPSPEEPVTECQDCGVPLATAEQINKRCSPCMLERKFETDGTTMDEWYGGFSNIESTEPSNPTCSNTTHKFSHCDCREPVSLDSATKITREGNTDAKFKQLHEVALIIVEYIEDPDRRKHYRSEIQQLAPSQKDTSTETCPSQKDTDWRELGPDEVIQEGDQVMGWEKRDWAWSIVDKHHINLPAHAFRPYKFRTRRRLPNSPESEGIKKQEEMPLEKELHYLTKEASRASDIHNHVLIVDCIRYLRDEIQKLKEGK